MSIYYSGYESLASPWITDVLELFLDVARQSPAVFGRFFNNERDAHSTSETIIVLME